MNKEHDNLDVDGIDEILPPPIDELQPGGVDKLLRYWAKQFEVYARVHTLYENKFQLYEHLITIPLIILTSVLGITSLSSIDNKTFSIMVTVLSFCATALAAVQKSLNFAKSEIEHRNIAVKCKKISNEILYNITAGKVTDDFLIYVRSQIDDITTNSPTGLD